MKNIGVTKKRLTFGFKGMRADVDEGVMDYDYSPYTINFTFRDGVLKGDMGLRDATGAYPDTPVTSHDYPSLPNGVVIQDAFAYTRRLNGAYDDRVVVQTSTGALYYTSIFSVDTWHEIASVVLTGKAEAVNYNFDGADVLLLASETSCLIMLNDTTATSISAAPSFSSLAVHYERVYGTVNGTNNQVWFSDDFDPTNWSVNSADAGYITFNDECGDVLKVVSFLNYLYVFREHGIFRVTAYGDQTEFSMKRVFVDTGRIYKNTIAVCGDKILFVADDGIFAFDGYDVTRIGKALPKIDFKTYAVAEYFQNCYYLACKVTLRGIEDVYLNNVVIAYDLTNGTYSMLNGFDVRRLRALNVHNATTVVVTLNRGVRNKLYALSNEGEVFGVATAKRYDTPVSTLGTERIKTVRSVTFTSKYNAVFTVIVDGTEYAFSVEGSVQPQTVFVGKSGRNIGFRLTASTINAYITPPVVEIDVL